MFKSLHALQGVLAVQRAEIAQTMGDRPVGVASCEVLDELIARIRTVTEVVDPDMPVTVSGMMTHGGDALELMRLTSAALSQLGTISSECSDSVYALRQPQIELIDVIESQGYAVDLETFTKVTDAQNRDSDDLDTPDVQVQLEADRITRLEQARVYQQRLEEMDAEILAVETEYAQRIRQIAPSGPGEQ